MRIRRLLNNKSVTSPEMFSTAAARTSERCAGRSVLVIQDTTAVNSKGGDGLYLHPTLVVDADDGSIVGLAHAQFLQRQSGRKADRRQRAIKDKESQRCLHGAQAPARICQTAREVTVVADRESDIYAAFALRRPTVHLLVRAAQDRSLEDGERLFARIDALAQAGRVKLCLPAKAGRPAREATLAIRYSRVELARPKVDLARPKNGAPKDWPATVAVKSSMHAKSIRRRAKTSKGEDIHWRLIATPSVDNLEQALEITDIYRRRWAIDIDQA